ncbi:PREDICTED: uncharacterized protein LOC109220287 [Nicotiana attenuata]|uniref:uncharacterized protein LOC109220287 n=1 Tax=Nicotiana attenuata TaxID=49451 RepID=UPI000904C0EB|nr:PREDICTED: uncharacterized protein LOC109220287 [Nicotiana attenuata]
MISKIVKRLNGRQGKLLSHGGKATLIKSVLQFIPVYTLSAMTPPKGVFRLIEKYFANFFWGTSEDHKRYHWSSWNHLSLPIDEGGKGFRKLEDINNMLAMKRWWRIRSTSSLWARFISNKYCVRSHLVSNELAPGNSHACNHVLKIRNIAENHIVWQVNSGSSSFWWDNWSLKGPLATPVPDTPKSAKILVGEFIFDGQWNINKLKEFLPDHLAGLGGVIRDDQGDTIMAFSIPYNAENHNIAEAQATWIGTNWCIQNGFTQATLELDSLYIVEILRKESATSYKFSQIINKIREAINTFNIQISQCYREANQGADCLAKMTVNIQQPAYFYSNQQLPSQAKGHFLLDKDQVPSIRNKYDKANFFVS